MADVSKLTAQSLVARSPEQVSADLDGKTVLLSVENGEYYNMNAVGSRIWSLLEKPITVAELVTHLTEEFEIDAEKCQQEALTFLEQLSKNKLLQIAG
jgi:hypothetical protein